MSGEILNLALKKEIFEGLLDGSLNEIPIKKSNWWKKRLMDENTGRFKNFMVVAATSGSSDKVYFEIKYIELRDNNFIIGVKLINMDEGDSDSDIDTNLDNGEVVAPNIINPEVIEPVKINPVTIETDESGNTITKMIVNVKENVGISQISQDITVTKEGNVKIDEYSALKQTVLSLFDVFCNLEGNFVVNMPYITIRNNGQLVGTKYRFHIESDADTRVDYTKQEFVKYEDISDELFINTIASYMKKLMISNYVFINKNASGFKYGPNGELIFVLYATGRRRYFFKSR